MTADICEHCSGNGLDVALNGRILGNCRVCKGTGSATVVYEGKCPRLGRMVCDRTDAHDPSKSGGHTYAAPDAPDGHTTSEDAAERSRG